MNNKKTGGLMMMISRSLEVGAWTLNVNVFCILVTNFPSMCIYEHGTWSMNVIAIASKKNPASRCLAADRNP
jgi:hypothetical protein